MQLVSTHVLILATMSFGQIVLTVTLLAMRFSRTPVYLALAIFLIAVSLISSGHVIAALLPAEEQNIMFIKGEIPERLYPSLIVAAGGVLILGWFGQAGYYLVRCFRHLSDYRVRLKDVFSSTEQRELNWIGVLFTLLGCAWLALVTFITVSTIYNKEIIDACFGSGLSFLIIFLLSIWGLRQNPGFESEYTKANSSPTPEGEVGLSAAKYSRSGLENSRANRIAQKIEEAMKRDKLYLDANLSLSRLSNHIAVTPNHISQTLNEIMNSNFFNYVNRWRVDEAKRQIINSNNSILEVSIDAGFNSRSSFYKAFKYETGQTPNQYKHLHKRG